MLSANILICHFKSYDYKQLRPDAVNLFGIKVLIIFLFLHQNIYYGYSLESSCWGEANEYPQHWFIFYYYLPNMESKYFVLFFVVFFFFFVCVEVL